MSVTSLDDTFAALGNGARRAILARLAQGETALSELAAPFEMTQTAVTKHVRVLCDAGLVEIQKRGRTRYCRLSPEPMKDAAAWLQSYQTFWANTFESLADYLEQEP